MPKDKDFKRVVRTRMSKTGEAYTAARSQLRGDAGIDPAVLLERTSTDQLADHLAAVYSLAVRKLVELDAGVFRVERRGAQAWMARVPLRQVRRLWTRDGGARVSNSALRRHNRPAHP